MRYIPSFAAFILYCPRRMLLKGCSLLALGRHLLAWLERCEGDWLFSFCAAAALALKACDCCPCHHHCTPEYLFEGLQAEKLAGSVVEQWTLPVDVTSADIVAGTCESTMSPYETGPSCMPGSSSCLLCTPPFASGPPFRRPCHSPMTGPMPASSPASRRSIKTPLWELFTSSGVSSGAWSLSGVSGH